VQSVQIVSEQLVRVQYAYSIVVVSTNNSGARQLGRWWQQVKTREVMVYRGSDTCALASLVCDRLVYRVLVNAHAV